MLKAGIFQEARRTGCTWHTLPGVSKLTSLIRGPICCSPTLYFTITLCFTIHPHLRTNIPHCPENLCMNAWIPSVNLMARKRMDSSFRSSQDTTTQHRTEHAPSRDSAGASSATGSSSLSALSILKFCRYFNCKMFPVPFIGSNLCSSKCLCQLLKNCIQPIKRAFNPPLSGRVLCLLC